MRLAADLVYSPSDYSIALFDKGFCSLGLLNQWQDMGVDRHWLIPLKKEHNLTLFESEVYAVK